MTAWYQELNPTQEPFDIGLDKEGRALVSFNLTAVKSYSHRFLEELVSLLVAAGVGTFGSDIFIGAKARIPDGDGPFLSVLSRGGTTPLRTHNEIGPPAYQRPSAQIVARAKSSQAARGMAEDAYDALVGIRNQNVTA
jgi:hypothetical protein